MYSDSVVMTDYAKWEALAAEYDDDDDIVDAVNQKKEQLLRNKKYADEAFIRAENVNSEGAHQLALSAYELLLSEIDETYSITPLVKFLDDLFISCQLNAACCCIRLSQWDASLAYCNALLTAEYHDKLKLTQLIRISYFKCRSLLSKEVICTSKITQRQLAAQVNTFKEQLSRYCDSVEGRASQNTPEFRSQLQNYQKLFEEVDDFVKEHTAKRPVSVEESLNNASRLLQSGKFDLAISDYQLCLQHQGLSDSQCLVIHNGLAQSYMASGKHKQGADSFMSSVGFISASTPELRSKEQSAVCLKAAAIYFKLRLFEDASVAYLTCLQYLEDYITVHDSNGGFSSSADANITMLYHIGKAGLAAAWIALRRSLKEAAENIVHAANYFEKRTFELCCGSEDSTTTAVDLTSKLSTVCPLIQHLCTSYDSLGNCCMLLASSESGDGCGRLAQRHHDNCDFVCDRTVDCCNALLSLFDSQYHAFTGKTGSVVPDAAVATIKLLRTRRAYAYFAKAQLYSGHSLSHTNIVGEAQSSSVAVSSSGGSGLSDLARDLRRAFPAPLPVFKLTSKHTLNADHHVTVFENISEALMTYYDYAGGEYVDLENTLQAIACFQNLGGLMMTAARVEPFQLESYSTSDGRVDDVVLERGHDVWRQVAALCDKHTTALKQRLNSTAAATPGADNEVYYHQQQSLLALYNAGLFASLYDLTLAQRAFEAALSVRDVINSTQRLTSREKPHEYYITLGDLSYHLGQAYLRVGKLDYAMSEAREAVHCYYYTEAPAGRQLQEEDLLVWPEEALTREEKEDVDRTRARQSYALLAVALSLRGRTDLAELVIDHIRAGCIGPIEDGDKEVAAVRRQIEQKKPKVNPEASTTPTVASFMKPSADDDNEVNEDDSDAAKKAGSSQSDEGPTNVRVERFESEDPSERPTTSELAWRKFAQVAQKSSTFMWFYRQLKPVISLVMSLIITRQSNVSKSVETSVSQDVDYNLIMSYSILGCFLGLVIGIVIKIYQM